MPATGALSEPPGGNLPADRNYRTSFRSADKAEGYEHEYIQPGTTSGVLWELEQEILGEFFSVHSGKLSRGLDFACGTGRILSLVEKHVPETIGVDISDEMLEVARERCRDSTLVQADLTRDPDAVDGEFDLITAFRFFLEAEESLRESVLPWIRSRISRDGFFIANFHRNPTSLRGIYMRLRGRLAGKSIHTISLGTAKRMLEWHGFRIERVEGYAYLHYRGGGAARVRRRVERVLRHVPFLTRFASSFVVVARPVSARDF